MRRFLAILIISLLILTAFMPAFSSADTIEAAWLGSELTPEGQAKVRELVAECKSAVGTDEYDMAVWLHDWLTHNGRYDNALSYDRHDAEDILIDGIGVCEAYATAYSALLDEAGIENRYVVSDAMGHVWNLVKINGVWCHVDVTWDDPTTNPGGLEPVYSGLENHSYFGLTDDMMLDMEHYDWCGYDGALPSADSLDNVYIIRTEKAPLISTQAEFNEIMNSALDGMTGRVTIGFVSSDSSFDLTSAFSSWIETDSWRFCWYGCSYSGGSRILTISIDLYDENAGYACVTYNGSDSKLTEAMNACFRSGRTCIIAEDITEGEFDPDHIYEVCAASAAEAAIDCGCYANGYWFDTERRIVYFYTGYVYEEDLPEPMSTGFYRTSGFRYGALSNTGNPDSSTMIVFGRPTCYNTCTLMDDLSAYARILTKYGVKVVTALCDVDDTALYDSLAAVHPFSTYVTVGDYDYTMWEELANTGYETSQGVVFPVVFLYDNDGRLVYYSTGYVNDPGALVATAISFGEADEPEPQADLILPAGLIEILDGAFEGDTSIVSCMLPEGLRSIGSGAFAHCTSLEKVYIPSTVTTIGYGAFEGCDLLTIICEPGSPAYHYATDNGMRTASK